MPQSCMSLSESLLPSQGTIHCLSGDYSFKFFAHRITIFDKKTSALFFFDAETYIKSFDICNFFSYFLCLLCPDKFPL